MNQQEHEEIRQMNDHYRRAVEPSFLHQTAFEQALQEGEVSEGMVEQMVDRLYEPFPDRMKDLPVDPFEPTVVDSIHGEEGNGLGMAVVRNPWDITVHVSERLYHQQPIGVLLRPITDEVFRAGEALITDVCPRSAEVEADVMPARHYCLKIEPLPAWLSKFIGEGGYPTR